VGQSRFLVLFFLLPIVALSSGGIVAAQPSLSSGTGTTLDFSEQQEAVRAAFLRAGTARTPDKADVAALATFAEFVYGEEGERDELIAKLRNAAEHASDPESRRLSHAWLLQLRALVVANDALETLSASSTWRDPLKAPEGIRREALPAAQKSVEQAKEAIVGLGQMDRTVLETANIALAALVNRLDHRNDRAMKQLQPLWSRPARSAEEVPVWLAALRMAAEDQGQSDKSLASRLDRLELAIEQAHTYWSSHPAIAETMQTVVELATTGNLRARGRRALARLQAEKYAPSRSELTKLAWRLDDLPAGTRFLIEDLRQRTADANTTSKEWKELLQARLDFDLVLGNPARRLLVISVLLEERDIVPEGSLARRWALSALAEGYAEAGEPRIAAALAKTAAALALPTKVAELLKTASDPQVLEKAGTEFESPADLGADARLLEAAFEIRRRQKLPVDDSFAAVVGLIDNKIRIGESADVPRLIDELLELLRETPLSPVMLGDISDSPLIARQAGLALLADELEAAPYLLNSLIQKIRRFNQDLTRERMRQTIIAHMKAGNSSREYLYKLKDVALEFIREDRSRTALELYTADALPIILASDARPLSNGDGDAILESLAEVFTFLGESAIARQIILQAKGPNGFRAPEPPDEVCRRIRIAARNGLTASRPLANPSLTDVVSQLASLSCSAGPAEFRPVSPTNSPRLDWPSEESRLHTIVPSTGIVAELRHKSPANECRVSSLVGSDERRRAYLYLLDEERAKSLPNEIREADLIEALASSYSAEGDISSFLRRMAIDLLVDRSAAPPERIGRSTECLLHDLLDAGQEADAMLLVSSVRERIARRDGDAGARAFQESMQVTLRNLNASATPDRKVADLADLDQAVGDLKTASAETLRRRIVELATLYHALPARAFASERALELIRSAQKAASGKIKPDDQAAGILALLYAELEIANGSFANARKLVQQASNSKEHSGWNDLSMIDLRMRLESLRAFVEEVASKRPRMIEVSSKVANLEKRNAPPAELAVQLQSLVDAAAQAREYQIAVDALRKLTTLDVPFEDRDGFQARDSLAMTTTMAARNCQVSLGTASLSLRECAIGAVRMSAVVAADKIRQKSERSREEEDVIKPGDHDLKEILEVLPPLLTGGATPVQAELGVILRWFVAERSSKVAAASREQIEDAASVEDKATTPLRVWRKARADWLVQEGRYRCRLAVGQNADALATLSDAASAARMAAEIAWSGLTASIPEGKSLSPIAELDLAAFQSSLKDDEAVLSYTVDESDVVIWLVRKDAIGLYRMRWDNSRKDVRGMLGQLSAQQGLSVPMRLEEARRIYEVLVAPVQDQLSGVRALLIDTDAVTSRVPFAALVANPTPSPTWSVNEPWTPDWLARRFAISLIPSLTTFASQRSISGGDLARRVLAAGDPADLPADVAYDNEPCADAFGISLTEPDRGLVPGARQELDETMKLAGTQGRLVSQGAFVPDLLQQMSLRDFGLVIFATHGQPEQYDRPARLLLSPRTSASVTSRTWLTATELMQLEFNADLVVLSACSSGLNVGGGLNGLVTGFLRAGARQVIATAWPVGEQIGQGVTLPLVRHYLQNGGKDVDLALHAAVQQMIDMPDSRFRHPYFWAGVFLLGPPYRS
jgi:CHAT domain-containing protein